MSEPIGAPNSRRRIGVLALQGDVEEHLSMLDRLGVEGLSVKRPESLNLIDGLIIPGGESTTIGKLAVEYGLIQPIRDMIQRGVPVWGTCAGMILLADDIGRDQPLIGGLDVLADRNAFGRQVDSFEMDLGIEGLEGDPFRAVFIRAPAIKQAGPTVDVLAELDGGAIVAVRQGNLMATAFHPELTGDTRLHEYFLSLTPYV